MGGLSIYIYIHIHIIIVLVHKSHSRENTQTGFSPKRIVLQELEDLTFEQSSDSFEVAMHHRFALQEAG